MVLLANASSIGGEIISERIPTKPQLHWQNRVKYNTQTVLSVFTYFCLNCLFGQSRMVCVQEEWARRWLSGRQSAAQPPLAAVGPRTPTSHLLFPAMQMSHLASPASLAGGIS